MQENRRNIIPVIKVTITTFFIFTDSKYLKIMIEGQGVLERIRLLTVEGQQTKAVLAQTCMGVFFIRSVPDTIFVVLFSYESACGPPVVRRPQFDKTALKGK
jgi:hypothetical protein